MAVEPEISTQVIRRSAAIKAEIVSPDERETLGVRILLNYGHTIGHALESSTCYCHFLHGEGVSVGMMGAARISQELGMIPQELVARQKRLLERFNLPIRAKGLRWKACSNHVPGQEDGWGQGALRVAGRGRQGRGARRRAQELVEATLQELTS